MAGDTVTVQLNQGGAPPQDIPQSAQEQVDEVIRRFEDARAKCSRRDENFKAFHRLYAMDHFDQAPKAGEEQHPSNAITNVIDLNDGILTANPIEWVAFGGDGSDEAKRRASEVEKFLSAVFYVNDERYETDVQADATHQQSKYGWACIRTYWDWSLAGDNAGPGPEEVLEQLEGGGTIEGPSESQESLPTPPPPVPFGGAAQPLEPQEEKVYEKLPIVVQVIPPGYIYPMPGGHSGQWQYVVYATRRYIADIESEYGGMSAWEHLGRREKMQTQVDFLDYWGWDSEGQVVNAVVAEKQLLKAFTVESGYDDLPYTIFFYRKNDSENLDEIGLSMAHAIRDSVQSLEKRVNTKIRLTNVYGSMPPVVTTKEGRKVQVDASVGNVIELMEGETFGFPQWPGTPPDVDELIGFLSSEIQQGSFSGASFGNVPSGIPGYGITQLLGADQIRLTQPKRQLEMAFGLVGRKILSLMRNFSPDAAVRVYGNYRGQMFQMSLKGLDMEGFRVTARLRPKFPQEDIRKAVIGNQLAANPNVPVSQRWISETFFGIEQPEDEQREKLKDMAMRHPLVIEYEILKALMESGRQDIVNLILQGKQQAGGGGGRLPPQRQGPGSDVMSQQEYAGVPRGELGLNPTEGGPETQSAEQISGVEDILSGLLGGA